MNEQLFSDDEDPNVVQLTINEHYAKAFEYKKEREELERRECSYTSFINNLFLKKFSQSEIRLGL